MSTRSFLGVKRPGRDTDLTPPSTDEGTKGPVQACNRTALPFTDRCTEGYIEHNAQEPAENIKMCVTVVLKDPIYTYVEGTMTNPLKYSSKYNMDTT
jgi:hypothetical protein